jgi:hypothetical protein
VPKTKEEGNCAIIYTSTFLTIAIHCSLIIHTDYTTATLFRGDNYKTKFLCIILQEFLLLSIIL